eukprot:4737858-Prorocentrum_lima.AAC.1
MTSSLVGSEMCIRDRNKQMRKSMEKTLPDMFAFCNWKLLLRLGHSTQAVSYTHLDAADDM